MTVAVGPDFLCVGMPKAGTQWLFDQLQSHPDFWMPPIKELYYLDHEIPNLKRAKKLRKAIARRPNIIERRSSKRRPWDERDNQFLEEARRISGMPRDIDRYVSLFQCKGNAKTGDITPNYCRLQKDIVTQIAQTLPHIKILLLVRDPVARAWSHICMWHRQGKFDAGLLESSSKFRSFLEGNDHLLSISLATRTAKMWTQCAPQISFRYFFLDDIATRPNEIRKDVLSFLEADLDKPARFAPDFNRKSDTAKLVLTEDIKAVLAHHFTQELHDCAAAFGGHAVSWAAKYGV